METKVDSRRMERIRRRCGFLNGIEVDATGSRGGLCLAWRGDISIRLQSYSKSHIDVFIEDVERGKNWRFIDFYGSPYSNKEESWNLLRHLSNASELPWMVCGDFNEILYGAEKQGGLPREEGRMEAFRTVLEDCNLRDMGFSGRWFTWERGNLPETNIRERLDRGVAMEEWISLFSDFQIRHMSHSFSDHCPLLITTKQEDKRRLARGFQFEAWYM
ncbi:hypothetical protein Gotur_036121 [Gossypium turneri]